MKTTASSIERLEARIAPASLVTITGKVATWTDVDGDLITLKWTGATAPVFADHVPTNSSAGGTLVDSITLKNSGDAISLKIKAATTGDGRVNLGHIAAPGLPLKSFSAPLASVLEFDAGDAVHAIGALTIGSYGTLPPASFSSPGGDGLGSLNGAVGALKISGDLDYGELVLGSVFGTAVGSVTVGGSLHGDVVGASVAGKLEIDGPAGAIKIGGSVIGSRTVGNGVLSAVSGFKTASIGGDIVGGVVNVASGTGFKLSGSVIGGTSAGSGVVSLGVVKSVVIGGDIRGGSAYNTGLLKVVSAGSITVKGSVSGGDVVNPALDQATGGIFSSGSVGSITIGHNLIAGTTTNTNTNTQVTKNGAVLVGGTLGSMSIGGSIEGRNATRAYIVAQGTGALGSDSTPPNAGNFNGLGKLTVKGGVSYAIIASGQNGLAHPGPLGDAENPDAGIGSVSIGGDYYHSSLLAGTNDRGAAGVGDVGADTQSIGDAARHAILGPVTIKGAILDDQSAAGFSGFEGEQIARITVSGHTVFTHGDPIRFFAPSHYVFATEIAAT